jgi:hypothetical protein
MNPISTMNAEQLNPRRRTSCRAICRTERCSLYWSEAPKDAARHKQMRLRFGTKTARVVALIVLLMSVADYWTYDRWDPTAPMNASGPEAMAIVASQRTQTASLCGANLLDDHCVCCSAALVPPAPVLRLPDLVSHVQCFVYSVPSAAGLTTGFTASPQLWEVIGFYRPMRV